VGGSNMTKDLAVGLRIPEAEAEKIKQRHGCALGDMITPGEMIEMPKVGGRDPSPMPRRKLSEIIEPRAEEIFSLVKEQCEDNGLVGRLNAGIVLTGGGAIMEGMTDLAERVFRLPVRRGLPRFLGNTVDAVNGPMYATGVGLALRELQQHRSNGVVRSGHGWQRMRERVAEWFRDFF
jgi:cell division protein FtsA